jgi:hypothetical protein
VSKYFTLSFAASALATDPEATNDPPADSIIRSFGRLLAAASNVTRSIMRGDRIAHPKKHKLQSANQRLSGNRRSIFLKE